MRRIETALMKIFRMTIDVGENSKGAIRSSRFCQNHDSTNPGSKYRRDHRYRSQFHHTISELTKAYKTKEKIIGFNEIQAMYEDEYPRALSEQFWNTESEEEKEKLLATSKTSSIKK